MQSNHHALEIGRSLQSPQTGFVHYCAQSEEANRHDTIPLYENALFALSLFRSRIAENVMEGKALFEKLLPFEVGGNFPVYLHEYPQTTDPYLSLRLLPVFFWLLHDFSHILGELKPKLVSCMERLLSYCPTLDLKGWAKERLDAFEGKVGLFPSTLHELSEALISWQIAEKKGGNIESHLLQAAKLWHLELKTYIGPAKRRHQMKGETECSLFDLYMEQWSQTPSSYPLSPLHLRGALIRPCVTPLSFSEQPTPLVLFNSEEECPLWIGWGRHTFVLEGKGLKVKKEGERMTLDLLEEDEYPVNFYLNYHRDHTLLVNGKKATTFQKGDEVTILSRGASITLSFFSEEGSYFGHIMRGNRPSQHGCKGEDHFGAFDWRITLRTVRAGKQPIQVRFQVAEQKQENQPLLPLHEDHCQHTVSLP